MESAAVVLGIEFAVSQASPTRRVISPKGLTMAPLLYLCSKQGTVQMAPSMGEQLAKPRQTKAMLRDEQEKW